MPFESKVNPLPHEVQLYIGPQSLHPVKQGKQVWLILVKPDGHEEIQYPWYRIEDDEQLIQFNALVQFVQFGEHVIQRLVVESIYVLLGHEFVHVDMLDDMRRANPFLHFEQILIDSQISQLSEHNWQAPDNSKYPAGQAVTHLLASKTYPELHCKQLSLFVIHDAHYGEQIRQAVEFKKYPLMQLLHPKLGSNL